MTSTAASFTSQPKLLIKATRSSFVFNLTELMPPVAEVSVGPAGFAMFQTTRAIAMTSRTTAAMYSQVLFSFIDMMTTLHPSIQLIENMRKDGRLCCRPSLHKERKILKQRKLLCLAFVLKCVKIRKNLIRSVQDAVLTALSTKQSHQLLG